MGVGVTQGSVNDFDPHLAFLGRGNLNFFHYYVHQNDDTSQYGQEQVRGFAANMISGLKL